MHDEEIVKRVIGGDSEAFGIMVEKYSTMLYSATYTVLGDFHVAQDIAQEAFIKAYMHMTCLQKPERLGNWLYSIAHRLSLNVLRSKRSIESLDVHTNIADPNGLEEEVMRRIDRNRIWEALSVLDKRSRSAVILHYFGGLSSAEISRIQESTPRAIESRIRRSRQQLKKELLKTMEEVFANEKLDPGFKQNVLDKIIAKEPFTLIGYSLAVPFPELGKAVRRAVKQIHDRLGALSNRINQDIYCLIPPQKFDPQLPVLFVGIEAAASSTLPEGMEALSIPQQKYAVSTFKGTLDQYDEFHRSIPGVITSEGYVPLDMWQSYCFEYYPEQTYDWSDDKAFQEIRLHWAIK